MSSKSVTVILKKVKYRKIPSKSVTVVLELIETWRDLKIIRAWPLTIFKKTVTT